MKSRINDDFMKAYRKLPKNVREQARKAYRLFRDNPQHPSQPIYSARVSYRYRTVGIMVDDTIVWFWIGSHTNYDTLLANL